MIWLYLIKSYDKGNIRINEDKTKIKLEPNKIILELEDIVLKQDEY